MRMLIFLLIGVSAFAADGDGWRKVVLTPNHPLKQTFYRNSMADELFFPVDTGVDSAITQVGHVGRVSAGEFSKQSDALAAKILNALGIDFAHMPAAQKQNGEMRFAAGVKGDLPGRAYQYSAEDSDGESWTSCVVIVRDRQKMHALYYRSFSSLNANCSHELESIARSRVLYE